MTNPPKVCSECKGILETRKEDYLLDEEDIGLPDIIIPQIPVSRCTRCGDETLHFSGTADVLKTIGTVILNKQGLLTVKEWEWLCNYTLSRTIGAPWSDPEAEG